MLFDFLRNLRMPLTWKLKPKKFNKDDKNNFGGKCIFPEFILNDIMIEEVLPPYTFEISHSKGVYRTNCGVLEFTSEGKEIIMPEWMFQQLDLYDITRIKCELSYLPKGKYVQLLPHSPDFLDIEEPKSELEKALVNYQVLSPGDEILCELSMGPMRFTVTSIDPNQSGIYIVDTDLAVDFLPPIGYEEKIEREKTVKKYLNIHDEGSKPKRINMERMGLFFDWDSFN